MRPGAHFAAGLLIIGYLLLRWCDLGTIKQGAKENRARRDLLLNIQHSVQKQWADEKIFEADAPKGGWYAGPGRWGRLGSPEGGLEAYTRTRCRAAARPAATAAALHDVTPLKIRIQTHIHAPQLPYPAPPNLSPPRPPQRARPPAPSSSATFPTPT